ncbi:MULTISPECIES: acetolactate decarboxylase [Roseobacteraceae]|uniref:Alpha-acetolactate decarboxylase n=1 Tax=Pseudosulfitobacter pseudonitzschiae TaxID=1402135 RepID=A0A221JWS0_9RHOB|nr:MULTISPECIES: acetolactate decarboxylase [Roseobacteraceae]ASM71191.1 alpha-acetolactate decarboxylase [Pseudosulfitobacter pseudonitzschiae]
MKLIPLTLFAVTLPCFTFAQELTAHGNFRHMIHSGETDGTIALDTLTAPSAWGLGAIAGLRGEILIRDGAILVSRGDDAHARVAPPEAGEEAVVLAYGTVTDWQKIEIPHDMAPDRLTHFIEIQAQSIGLDLDGGSPIRVQGSFPHLVWHVVTGEASAQGADGGHGRGHSNIQSGMNIYDEAGTTGEIVGVYTGAALEGIASHPGKKLHLHFVSSDGMRSGHVDEITIPAGAALLLPKAQQAAALDPAVHDPAPALREGGQSAFAALQEITVALMADPATDWSKVDIEALRRHLIEMDNVTLRADVTREKIDEGARFVVTSANPDVTASIRAMVPAHVATMNGVEGWAMQVEEVEGGVIMTVTGPDTARIRGLGFIGLMTVGMHHQAHHMALASGRSQHDH